MERARLADKAGVDIKTARNIITRKATRIVSPDTDYDRVDGLERLGLLLTC